MPQWEYTKRDLSNLPPRTDDVDLLNDCGGEGWELVCVSVNGTAYLRRPKVPGPAEEPSAAKPRARRKVAG
jgi:hypothetical protein